MSAGTSERRESYHHGDLREALIDAACGLIEEGGIEALSIRGAARQAGVSVAAPYRHFDSKEALVAAVGTEGFGRFAGEMRGAIEAIEDPFERLTAIGHVYVRFALRHPAFFQVMFSAQWGDRDAYPELRANSDRAFEVLHGIVEDCHRAVGSKLSPEVTAITAWSLVHGLSSLIMADCLKDKTAEDSERITAAVLAQFERALRSLGADG